MRQENRELDGVGFRIDVGLFDEDGWHRDGSDTCTADALDGTD
jgi:hypothetical protein